MENQNRRRVLSAVGSAFAISVSGCSGEGDIQSTTSESTAGPSEKSEIETTNSTPTETEQPEVTAEALSDLKRSFLIDKEEVVSRFGKEADLSQLHTVTDDSVYYGGGNEFANLVKIDRDSGRVQWLAEELGELAHPLPDLDLVLGSGGAVEAATGKVVWRGPSQILARDGNQGWMNTRDFYKLVDLKSGKVQEVAAKSSYNNLSSPAVDVKNRVIYENTVKGVMVLSIPKTTNSPKKTYNWVRLIGFDPDANVFEQDPAKWELLDENRETSRVILSGELAIVKTQKSIITVRRDEIRTADEPLADLKFGEKVLTVVPDGNTLFTKVRTSDGTEEFHAYDGLTGEQLWDVNPSDVISKRNVFIEASFGEYLACDTGGEVRYIFDKNTGELIGDISTNMKHESSEHRGPGFGSETYGDLWIFDDQYMSAGFEWNSIFST